MDAKPGAALRDSHDNSPFNMRCGRQTGENARTDPPAPRAEGFGSSFMNIGSDKNGFAQRKLDKEYETANAFNTPGRTFSALVAYESAP